MTGIVIERVPGAPEKVRIEWRHEIYRQQRPTKGPAQPIIKQVEVNGQRALVKGHTICRILTYPEPVIQGDGMKVPDAEELIAEAICYCSAADNFSRPTGCRISLMRALKKAQREKTLPGPARRIIGLAFANRKKSAQGNRQAS